MSHPLNIQAEADNAVSWDNLPVPVLLAEGESLFGEIPEAHRKAYRFDLAQSLLLGQSKKEIPEGLEVIHLDSGLIVAGQVPGKAGLDILDRIRLAGARLFDLAKSRGLREINVLVNRAAPDRIQALVEGLHLGGYGFEKYRTSGKKPHLPERIRFIVPPRQARAIGALIEDTRKVMAEVARCRDLVNETGTTLNPVAFAELAETAAVDLRLNVKVRDEKAMWDEGFSGLWTVGKGSDFPPRLVTLGYDVPGSKARKDAPHLCLVGKGITFDTGGISIKPSSGMWEMKSDMAGAATALAGICAVAALGLPIRVSAVLCLAENRPGNRAVLPGDIFTAKNGKTVMVDNTDAEGRLALTDGLAEAGLLGATHIIDMATLTGAIVRAVGPAVAGLFGNDASFAALIRQEAAKVGEKFCELPLEAEYREYLDDPAADMKNAGKSEAGAITAALFLQEFVPEGTAWAHWDIAGTAFTTGTWKYFKPGGTGWGVKTLVQVARRLAGQA